MEFGYSPTDCIRHLFWGGQWRHRNTIAAYAHLFANWLPRLLISFERLCTSEFWRNASSFKKYRKAMSDYMNEDDPLEFDLYSVGDVEKKISSLKNRARESRIGEIKDLIRDDLDDIEGASEWASWAAYRMV